jgi:hypothetical protein
MRRFTIQCIDCGVDVPNAARQRRRCDGCRSARRKSQAGKTRYLRPGEQIPDGEPTRYRAAHGYVRLRWKIGPGEYLEAYEHRVIAGATSGDGLHVHHANHVKTDNDPSNLVPIAPDEHGRRHAEIDLAEVVRLYESGLSTYEIARTMGIPHASTVWRALSRSGAALRSERRVAIPKRERE